MMSIKLSDIAILNIECSDYRSIISLISKNEAINLMENADLNKKGGNVLNIKNLFSYIKMAKEILTFDDIEIEKNRFHRHKTPIVLRDVDTEKVFVSKKISFGYYIGYLYHDNKVKPLHIRLPKTTAYVKSYEGKTKWMYF